MDGKKRTQLILLGLMVVVVLALFGYLAIRVGSVRTSDGITVDAVFDDAQGVVENGSVRIAGIKVGVVAKLWVEGKRARVTMYLDPNIRIRKDVVATIKAKSLLGEKFVELIPQGDSAPELQDGDMIEKTFVAAELPDLASQIAPLLAKINPDDVSKLVNVMSRILEQNEDDFPKIVSALGRVAVNVDGMLTRNGPKIDRIVDATYDAVYKAGPKAEKLIDTTQRTLDNANRVIEANGDKIGKFTDGLSQLDMARINRMIGELEKAMAGAPDTLGQAKDVVYKVNNLLDGFEGLNWADLKSLVRDDGINVRIRARSDDDVKADYEKWTPKKKIPAANASTPANP